MTILPYQRGRIVHRRRRSGVSSAPVPPPPVAPVLILASFAIDELGVGILTLGFDVDVDVAGVVPEAFAVTDGPGGLAWGRGR